MAQYIEETRSSPYLETLLIPAVGPRPIPDDIMKEHTSKAETTTYNITVPDSGSGLFVFYPNNNTGLIGHHYVWDGTTYVYDGTTGPLTTAQDLYENYNYGRLISQIITVKSSTLPAGVYALNGTFNAINIYNTLSEVSGGLNYNNLLSLNNNITDKIGNVLVGDGIALLSLPQTFDKPYTRFNDPTPFTAGANVNVTQRPVMVDDEASMVNMSTFEVLNMASGVSTVIATINVDSTTPMQLQGLLAINHPNAATQMQLTAVFLDAFGKVIAIHDLVNDSAPVSGGFATNRPFSLDYTGSYYTNNTQPVAAIRFSVFFNASSTKVTLNIGIRPLGASNPGTNQPISLVAYQGVAGGSQITLSGITNYELIPNSNLKKNLKTEYGHYDPTELDYVKRILMNKDRFGIRTVQALPDYNRSREIYRDLYLLDSEVLAKSFSWNKLLKTIKDIVLKGTATLFPMTAPLVNVVDEFATNLTDRYVKSAGGNPIVPVARSAGGTPINARARNHIKLHARAAGDETAIQLLDEGLITSRQFDGMRSGGETKGLTTDVGFDNDVMKNSSGDRILNVEGLGTCGVPFVVILFEGERPVGCALYVALKGDFSAYLPKGMRGHYALSKNGYKVHGWMGDQYPHNLIHDATLLPVSQVSGNRISVPTTGWPVVENSCDGAVCVSQIADWLGVKDTVVIGSVQEATYPTYQIPVAEQLRRAVLMPNMASVIKKRYLAGLGLRSVESDIGVTYSVRAAASVVGSGTQMEVVAKIRSLDTVDEVSIAVLDELSVIARSSNTNPFIDMEDEPENPFLDLPPPPDFIVENVSMDLLDQQEVKAIWDEASAELSKTDPVFSEAMLLLNWLYQSKMVTTLAEFARTDPSALRFKKMLINYVNVPGVVRVNNNPTAAEAQMGKAQRLSDSLSAQYPGITPQWIIQNGYRGPSTDQARYFRYNRALPDPGLTVEDKTNDRNQAIVTNVLKGFPQANQDQIQRLVDLVDNINKGPSPDQLREIFGTGRSNLQSTVENMITNNRLSEAEAAAVRLKVNELGRGLTGEELAVIRGKPVRQKVRITAEAPAMPIFSQPGTSARLRRMLASDNEMI